MSVTHTNSHPIAINGLAELAADLPDEGWYELRVQIKREGDGARVLIPQIMHKLDGEPSGPAAPTHVEEAV